MTITDSILQWQKRRARKKRNHAWYFKLVGIIARRESKKMTEQMLNKSKYSHDKKR
jgi:hypothetical protein